MNARLSWVGTTFLALAMAACEDRETRRAHLPDRTTDIAAIAALKKGIGSADFLLVYVGASDCGFANSPRSREHVQQTIAHFRSQYASVSRNLVTIGIALDRNRASGQTYLHAIGGFDYIFPQGNLANIGMVRYAATNLGLPFSTPQLALFAVGHASAPNGEQTPVLLRRVQGASEIVRWIREEWPLTFMR